MQLAHMGAPRDFGMSSRGLNHIIFSEGRGGVGQTIDMIRQLGDTTQELRLYDSADRLLMTLNWNTRAFGVPNQG